ncbi:helix-turn-helix domain-containing protein [Paenibacillus solisilvae]|uniref:Helix-turn-helix domain-containing protein n=1 Tax=Paenibacillus solisilvae TaxID=2486751 RepID=A0ABW0W4A8_9BACL
MKTTYQTIIQNYFHSFRAEVSMAAFSNTKPGLVVEDSIDYYRLWYVYQGEGQIILNDRIFDVRAGHLVLLPPGTPQTFGNSERSIGIFWCHFRASLGDMQVFELFKLPICVIPENKDQMIGLFTKLIEAYHSRGITRELRMRSALLDIIACYLEHCDLSEQALVDNETLEKIDRVLEYIDVHLAENIGVEELARLVYLHPNYFIGFFKNFVGCSPIHYVNIRRLERAKRLLEETSDQISSVAMKVGMKNHYLSRLFKQVTGLSPSRYRQIFRSSYRGQFLEERGVPVDDDDSRTIF